MAMRKRTLRVYPNPWALIHPEHGPIGVCPKEMGDSNVRDYIGAEIQSELIEKRDVAKTRDPNRPSRHAISFAVSDAVVEVPDTQYYRRRLRDGDLIPAEPDLRGIKAKFRTVAEAREAGIRDFEALYGKGAFGQFNTTEDGAGD